MKNIAAVNFIRKHFKANDQLCIFLKNPTKLTKRHPKGEVEQHFIPASELTTRQMQSWLHAKNNEGFSVYIGANSIKSGAVTRTENDIAQLRNVYLDIDSNGDAALKQINADIKSGVIPQYTTLLNTSPGKYQPFWPVDDFTIAQYKELERALAKRYGADMAATDAARVLRLPGFINTKPDYAIKPVVSGKTIDGILISSPADFKIEREIASVYEIKSSAKSDKTDSAGHKPPDISNSGKDWSWVCKELETRVGGKESIIEDLIRELDVKRPEKHGNYARLTVCNAASYIKSKKAGKEKTGVITRHAATGEKFTYRLNSNGTKTLMPQAGKNVKPTEYTGNSPPLYIKTPIISHINNQPDERTDNMRIVERMMEVHAASPIFNKNEDLQKKFGAELIKRDSAKFATWHVPEKNLSDFRAIQAERTIPRTPKSFNPVLAKAGCAYNITNGTHVAPSNEVAEQMRAAREKLIIRDSDTFHMSDELSNRYKGSFIRNENGKGGEWLFDTQKERDTAAAALEKVKQNLKDFVPEKPVRERLPLVEKKPDMQKELTNGFRAFAGPEKKAIKEELGVTWNNRNKSWEVDVTGLDQKATAEKLEKAQKYMDKIGGGDGPKGLEKDNGKKGPEQGRAAKAVEAIANIVETTKRDGPGM